LSATGSNCIDIAACMIVNSILASKYRPGYVLECCDILLLILVGLYRILAGCLADSNLITHWNAITVPHIPMWSRYHILFISVWFYCLLITLHYQLCATTPLFYVNLKQRDRLHYWSMQKCFILTWSTRMMKTDTISPLRQPCVWAIHTTTV